jgi:hypothetical protein
MDMTNLPSKTYCCLLVCFCLCLAGPAQALVLFPSDEADIANLTSKPPTGVMVRWNSNASGVMISPNHVLTTKHQGGGVGTTVRVNGVQYVIAGEVAHSSADIRVDRLVTTSGVCANLPDYVSLYTTRDERNKVVTIGGFGRRRGSELLTASGTVYGYAWADNDNSTLSWGRNKVDGLMLANDTVVATAHFDAPGKTDYVTYEAGIAQFDSGGGWFVYNSTSGMWSVLGLTCGAEHAATSQSWFGTSTDPSTSDPDLLDAVRVSDYANWITTTAMHDQAIRVPGDATCDGLVDGSDLNLLLSNWNLSGATWDQGDFSGDGFVDGSDLNLLLSNWGTQASQSTTASPTVSSSADGTVADTQLTLAATGVSAAAGQAGSDAASTTPLQGTGVLDVKISYQPATVNAPQGYLVDAGLPFGKTASGYSYGWAQDLSGLTIQHDNTKTTGTSQGTGITLPEGGTWEISVPGGMYDVKITGDAGGSSARQFSVEGVPLTWPMSQAASGWLEETLTVVVTDGRLTITAGPGSSICFVQITAK